MRALEGVLCQGLMARLGICRVQSEADRVMVLKSSCGTRAGGTFFVVLQLLFSPRYNANVILVSLLAPHLMPGRRGPTLS